jgi:hypothetical protein
MVTAQIVDRKYLLKNRKVNQIHRANAVLLAGWQLLAGYQGILSMGRHVATILRLRWMEDALVWKPC